MAGFLEALGRSGALPALTRDVIGTWGGLQRLEFERERAQREKEMFPVEKQYAQTRQALGETQLNLARMEGEREQRREAFRKRTIPVAQFAGRPFFEELYEVANQWGLVSKHEETGEEYVTGEHAEFLHNQMMQDWNLTKSIIDKRINRLKLRRVEIDRMLQDPEAKVKDKDKQTLQNEKLAILQEEGTLIGNARDITEGIQNREIMQRRIDELRQTVQLPPMAWTALQTAADSANLPEFNKIMMELVKPELKPEVTPQEKAAIIHERGRVKAAEIAAEAGIEREKEKAKKPVGADPVMWKEFQMYLKTFKAQFEGQEPMSWTEWIEWREKTKKRKTSLEEALGGGGAELVYDPKTGTLAPRKP